MSGLDELYDDHGATYTDVSGRSVPAEFGRPQRAHLAVRNGVGITEHPFDAVAVTGADRIEYLDNVLSNHVPTEAGTGTYALLLDPQGKIRVDVYVFVDTERALVLLPPGRGPDLVDEWRERVFIQDVSFELLSEDRVVFGVHGPNATEKVASATSGTAPPAERYTFSDGTIGGVAVLVIAGDGLAGEEDFLVIGPREDSSRLYDALLTLGMGAAPFGRQTWHSLTLEAGTPLLEPDFRGEIPNLFGLTCAIDFDKGCYVGQEVVSRVANRGQPSRRLIGLRADARPEPGAAVFSGDAAVGEVTRSANSPIREEALAFALVPFDADLTEPRVRVDGSEHDATQVELPFVDGSARSVRLPQY